MDSYARVRQWICHVSWARNVELSGPVPGVDTSHESLACRLDALAEDMLRNLEP